jgi:hypothetical protein
MENHPCANAFNLRLGSLIKDIGMDKNGMGFVSAFKFNPVSNYKSYNIRFLGVENDLSISFVNDNGFYNYLLVVSY